MKEANDRVGRGARRERGARRDWSPVFHRMMLVAIVLAGMMAAGADGGEPRQERPIRVAVYGGEGVANCEGLVGVFDGEKEGLAYEVSKIGPQEIRRGSLSEVDVLIHPGGSGGKQGRDLETEGREAVRSFVKGGGGYVGICAGAYLATNDYSWSLGLIDAKVTDRKHWARGRGVVTVELSPDGQRFFGSKEKNLEIYYGQGPLLARREWDDPLAPDYESLAVYRTGIAKNGAPAGVMPGTSAMVRSRFGRGRVFCFSPHPEKSESLGYLVREAVKWTAGRKQRAGENKTAVAKPSHPVPPVVTADVWAVADGETGEVLWGEATDLPSKAASITKIMCAFTILEMAKKDPGILDERVTFSVLADKTPGSTAGIKAGESVTVRECLYGLLLPSGNDAGKALAEHFNARLDPPADGEKEGGKAKAGGRANFIAEMNRNAARLGLEDTCYRISFGDGGTPKDKTTTANDLCRLAFQVMQDPDFRKIVATREYSATVKQADGGQRTQVWQNSNQLLALGQGFDGIKTGTTRTAGACLLSRGTDSQGRVFIVVVLGSDSVKARYADTRNLFDWASRMSGKQ